MSTTKKEPFSGHKKLERNVTLLAAATLVTVAIGGIVEIAPLFWIDNTIEEVEGMDGAANRILIDDEDLEGKA